MAKVAEHLQGLGSSPIHVFSEECNKLIASGKEAINCTIGNPGHPIEPIAREAAKSILDYPVARKAFLLLKNDKNAELTREQYKTLKSFLREPAKLNYFLNPRELSPTQQKEALAIFKLKQTEKGTYKIAHHNLLSSATLAALTKYFDQEVGENIAYSPIRGYPRVLASAAKYMNKTYGYAESDPRSFRAENMGTSVSATFGFNQSATATIAPKEVLFLTSPYYPTYKNTAMILNANVVVIPSYEENGFVPTDADIEKAFTEAAQKYGPDKLKNWFVNYPNNPTGAYLNEAQATRMAKKIDELVKRYPSLTITLDDAYVDVSSAKNTPIRNKLSPESLQSVIMVYTASKAMGLAGERLGLWETNNKELATKLTAIASGVTMNSPTIAQTMMARTADYWIENPGKANAPAEFYAKNTELFSNEFNKRVAKFKEWLPEYQVPFRQISKATLYTFPNVDAFIGLPLLDGFEKDERLKGTAYIRDGHDFGISMLHMHEKGVPSVGAIPGAYYGADPKNIRFSLPFPSHEPLYKALGSIEKCMELGIEKVKLQLRQRGIDPTPANVRAEIGKNKTKALAELEARKNPGKVVAANANSAAVQTKNAGGFSVEINNVFRDFVQGLYGNRVPLDDPKALQIFSEWEKLGKSVTGEQKFKISAIEAGGAQPQVDSVFLNRDYTETMRKVREAAPTSPIRPLERATNVFMLEPRPLDEIKVVLKQVADDTAGRHLWGTSKELLRVKIFDSQGILKEVEPVVATIKDLRDQGYPICVEIGIPYSDGDSIKPNPYPDELYVTKIMESARMLQKHGIPADMTILSLKDMAGELSAKNAERLVGKIIDSLEKAGMKIKIGIHSHDTGLAVDAYAAAIAVCNKRNWPLSIDTVETEKYTAEGYKATGFASTAALNDKLKKQGIDLGFTSAQLDSLKRMAQISDEIAKDYTLGRKDSNLSGEDFRRFKIAGGAFASLVSGVQAAGIADKLGIEQNDAVRLTGEALIAVDKLMGHPFGVTPGMQNRQIGALHLLGNMINAGVLKPGMSLEQIIATVHTNFTDKQINDFFLKDLRELQPVVAEFLKGEMPAPVHPVIRNALGTRKGLLMDGVESRLPKIIETANQLWQEGLIKPTKSQIDNASAMLPRITFTEEKTRQMAIKALSNAMAFNSTVARGVVLGGAANLRQSITKPWLAEPLANNYVGDAEGYARAMRLFKAGLDHRPDEAELIRKKLITAESVKITEARSKAVELLNRERSEIQNSVVVYLKANQKLVQDSLANLQSGSTNNPFLKQIINSLYATQKSQVLARIEEGKQYLYKEGQRIDIALEALKTELAKSSPKDISARVSDAIKKIKDEIESSVVTAPTTGSIVNVFVKPGDVVKKGQTLYVIEAMKMQHHVIAARDGQKISETLFKKGANVKRGDVLVKFGNELQKAPVMIPASAANDNVDITKNVADRLKKQGYHVPPLSIRAGTAPDNIIHIIGNRAGCATKILGNLTQAGHKDIRILFADGDKSTPIIANAAPGSTIQIKSYMDQENILKQLEKLARENPNKKIMFHPGWGFLSEKDDFVLKMEELAQSKKLDIVFAGPPSEPMRIAGGKKTFRDLVAKAAPKFNPEYFGANKVDLDQTRKYVETGFPKAAPFMAVDMEYRKQFSEIQKMGGDVMIKAVAGGGGKGIINYKTDPALSDEANYKAYLVKMLDTREYASKFFDNDEVLVERCIRGKAHHIEVQFAAGAGQGITLGLRNCTAQNGGQKFAEMNVVQGDYPASLMQSINDAAEQTVASLAKIGYKGMGTLEMLVSPDTGKVTFLEVNTRVQVEHAVTEEDIFQKTGKRISLPELNVHLSTDNKNGPAEILDKLYGFKKADIEFIKQPGKERVVHFRVNSKYIDLVKGETIPSWYTDDMWPEGISRDITARTGAKILQGGLGDGKSDAQIGAIYGTRAQAVAAAEQMLRFSEFAQVCERDYDKRINLGEALQLFNCVVNKDGTLNKDFSISTVDRMLVDIKSEKIVLERDSKKELMPGQQEFTQESLAKAVTQIARQELEQVTANEKARVAVRAL